MEGSKKTKVVENIERYKICLATKGDTFLFHRQFSLPSIVRQGNKKYDMFNSLKTA